MNQTIRIAKSTSQMQVTLFDFYRILIFKNYLINMFRLTTILLFILTFTVCAQVVDITDDYKNARAKFEAEDYKGAIEGLTKLLPDLESVTFPDSTFYMEVYNILGASNMQLGNTKEGEAFLLKVFNHYSNNSNPRNYSNEYFSTLTLYNYYSDKGLINKSERLLRKGMELKRAAEGEANEDYITMLQGLSDLSMRQFKLSTADSCTQVMIVLKKQVYGENSVEYSRLIKHMADIDKSKGKYKAAEQKFLQVKKIFKDSLGEKSKDYLNVLNNLAQMYKEREEYKDAEAYFTEMASIYKKNNGTKSAEYGNCINNLSIIYKAQGLYVKAEELLKDALSSLKSSVGEKNLQYINTLRNLADLYRNMELYEKAESNYMECAQLMLQTIGEKSLEYANLLNNMSILSTDRSKYDIAEQQLLLSLKITKEVSNDKDNSYATTLDNLGLLYKKLGRFEEAEPLFKQSLQIRKENLGEKHSSYGFSLNNMADFYYSLGQFKQAEELYVQALNIAKGVYGEKHHEYALCLNNLATLYEEAKQYDKAEKAFNQSLSILKETVGEDHQDYALTLDNLANFYLTTGKFAQAEALNKQDQEIIKRKLGVNHPSYAFSLSTQAHILEKSQKYLEAEKIYIEIERIRKLTLGDHHIKYTETLIDLARIYTVKKDYQKAYDYWKQALNNFNDDIRQRFASLSEKEKEEFYSLIRVRFEQFNSFAFLVKDKIPAVIGDMYNVQLETKALLFSASNKMRQRILSSNNPVLIQNFNKWQQQKELLAQMLSLPKSEVYLNIDSLAKAVNESEKTLEMSSKDFRDINDNRVRTWQEVQKFIKPGEAAIEMIRFDAFNFEKGGVFDGYKDSTKSAIRYVALILKPGDLLPQFVLMTDPDGKSGGSDMEYRLIKFYRNVIRFKVEDPYCYNFYWKSIQDNLASIKKVYLSPDGVYNQINLQTLKNPVTQKYLIEEEVIEIVSNTWDLTQKQTRTSASKKVVLMGDPDFGNGERSSKLNRLPGTLEEVTRINSVLTSKQWAATVYTSAQSTEENIKSIKDARIVHIATHGFFQKDGEKSLDNESKTENNPLLKSGIYLANSTSIRKSGSEDGILSAYEAMNLNLDNTEIVILSACETGLGELKNGEGVYGLQRSLRVAGAGAVIISLWKVDDAATQKLMSYFYAELLKTGTIGNVRQAFTAAQMKLRTEYKDPFFWGAFVVVGGN